jgi:hypothetical protein
MLPIVQESGVGMGVNIDEAGRNVHARCVNSASAVTRRLGNVSDSRDSVTADSDIGLYWRRSGSIDNGSTSDNYIERQESSPLN